MDDVDRANQPNANAVEESKPSTLFSLSQNETASSTITAMLLIESASVPEGSVFSDPTAFQFHADVPSSNSSGDSMFDDATSTPSSSPPK